MKKIAVLFLVCSMMNMYAQNTYNLTNGTLVDITIIDEVSSENDNNVTVQVTHDVIDAKGNIIIKAGTPVQCSIERKKKSGVGKPGEITLSMLSVKSIDGQNIKLNGKFSKEGKNKKGVALGVGLGVGIGTFLLPMLAFIAKKGDAAVISQNTIVSNIPVLGNYEVK